MSPRLSMPKSEIRREGFVVNHKRLFRIYREERLMVRKRGGRKRALGDDYNTVRLHSRIGWLTPAAYAAKLSPQRDQDAPLRDCSAPWPVAPTEYDMNRQTLVTTG
jgi:hypothetical protein